MPTAVELKYFDAFVKLDAIDRPGEQRLLNEAFLKIDAAVPALSGASDVYVKLEHKYDRAFDVIGGAFLKIGGDFQELAMLGLKIDTAITGGSKAAASVNGGNAAADFLKLDSALKIEGADLKLFGGEFLKWNNAGSPTAFLKIEAALGDGSVRLADEAGALRGDFAALGADLVAAYNPDRANPIDLADKHFGGDLIKLSSQFDLLASDFIKLAGAFGGGAPTNADVASGGAGVGTSLAAVTADFLKIDTTLSSLAEPLAQLLLPAVKPTPT